MLKPLIGIGDPVNVVIRLKQPVAACGFWCVKKTVTTLYLHVDEPDRFAAALSQKAGCAR